MTEREIEREGGGKRVDEDERKEMKEQRNGIVESMDGSERGAMNGMKATKERTFRPKKKFWRLPSDSTQLSPRREQRRSEANKAGVWASGNHIHIGMYVGLENGCREYVECRVEKRRKEEKSARMHFRDITKEKGLCFRSKCILPFPSMFTMLLFNRDRIPHVQVEILVSGQEKRICLGFAHNVLEPVIEGLHWQIARIRCL